MNEGRVINGRFRLLSLLGQGGMGSVWRAIHLELGTPVAVKLIEPGVADSRLAFSRFKREAQAAAALRSANVVQILDYGVDDDVPYIAMELLEGESLAARLARSAPLPPRELAKILSQVGKALVRAHSLNIVHRDLKPDNIFLVRDGDDEIAKVLDFGIAKTISNSSLAASIQTKSGAILGTPHYMSPEQASGRSAVDHRSDIWSLGIIAFECLTGCRPFRGNTLGGLVIAICTEPIPRPSDVAPVPRGFNDWFARCVCRDQNERFQSVAEAIRTLCNICDPPPLTTTAVPMSEPVRERTLQNSSESIRQSFDAVFQRRAPAAAEHLESVSGASRTVGHPRRRRASAGYLLVGMLLLGGGAAGAIGVIRLGLIPATADSSLAVPTVLPIASASVISVLTSAPLATVPVEIPKPVVVSAVPVRPLQPIPSKGRQAGNSHPASAGSANPGASAQSEPPVPTSPPGEDNRPAPTGADPPSDETDARRRNIERLGF